MSDLHSRLQHQSLGRPLTDAERALADALEKVFLTGQHDFEEVARALERDGVQTSFGRKRAVDGRGAGAGARQDQRFIGCRLC